MLAGASAGEVLFSSLIRRSVSSKVVLWRAVESRWVERALGSSGAWARMVGWAVGWSWTDSWSGVGGWGWAIGEVWSGIVSGVAAVEFCCGAGSLVRAARDAGGWAVGGVPLLTLG